MRIPAEKWIEKNKLQYNEHMALAKGFVDTGHIILVVPKSDEAKTHCLINYGMEILEEDNKFLHHTTNELYGSVSAHDLRVHTNAGGNVTFRNSVIDSKYLKMLTKLYRRNKDVFGITGHEEDSAPIKIITPCNDWYVFIAPRADETGTRIGLDEFPMRMMEEDSITVKRISNTLYIKKHNKNTFNIETGEWE